VGTEQHTAALSKSFISETRPALGVEPIDHSTKKSKTWVFILKKIEILRVNQGHRSAGEAA
jgi:hypothetical protein